MVARLEELLQQIHELQERVTEEISREAEGFGYSIRQGRVYFEREVVQKHREMATRVRRYLAQASWRVIATVPLVYSLLVPILLLDLFVSLYQLVCFPIYRIPRVRRRDFIALDRHRLH